MARDPPSYDSGTLVSEADAKTIMDKIEARRKWLQAKRQDARYTGSKWRDILARAKIFERAWHKLSQKGTIVGDDPKEFRAIYLFPLHGESETDLRNIWAAMQRAVSKTRPSSHDYSKLKAVFQQYKEANTNWKDILLAYRAEKIRDWNRHWHAIRRAMTEWRDAIRRAMTDWNRYLARDPPSYDSGIPLSETDAKTMMDKIKACTKWLNANDRACKLGKHQRVFQQRKHASEDSHTSSLMRS